MGNISSFSSCSGCGACAQVCPVDAIRMARESLYYTPEVDAQKCIDCGKCVRVCPVNTPREGNHILSAWAGANKNAETVKNSSSGAAFSAIAQNVMQQGGVVFGAVYREGCRKVAIDSTERVSLADLRKSKYVESNTEDTFHRVKGLLEAGTPVLYCGAPCQVAGLKAFLGKEYENLLTCDFTCGGMPSHKLYTAYLEVLENRYGAKVETVDFRPKTLGWENHAIRIRFASGQVYHQAARLDPYFSAFVYGHYSVKSLCMDCPFSDHHHADIVLADFWKHRDFPGFEQPGQGLSLLLATTQKGSRAVEAVREQMDMQPVDKEQASYNIRKTSCTQAHKERREAFLRDCEVYGIWEAGKRHCMPQGGEAWKVKAKSLIRFVLRGVK